MSERSCCGASERLTLTHCSNGTVARFRVTDDDLVVDALKTIEHTLQSHDDLNKVDIQKQDISDKDKELAQFVMSSGGKALGGRDRARSVPSLLSDGIDSQKLREENELITQIGLPDSQLLIGSKHVEMLEVRSSEGAPYV